MAGVGDESEFELTLDDNAAMSDATSAFPESEQKDIFETDFELPALDDESGSEAVALEESDTDLESSDFDLAIDEGDAGAEGEESGSQVVALEEDEAGEENLDELEAAEDVEAAIGSPGSSRGSGARQMGHSAGDRADPVRRGDGPRRDHELGISPRHAELPASRQGDSALGSLFRIVRRRQIARGLAAVHG